MIHRALLFALPWAALAGPASVASPEQPGHAQDPQWSPDGQRIAYEVVKQAERSTELHLLTVANGTAEALSPPGAGAGRFGPRSRVDHEFAWAPAGQLHAYASTAAGDEFDLYVATVSVPLGGPDKQGGPTWSPDNRWLVYCSAQTGEGDLYRLDVFALEQPAVRLTRHPGLDFYAAFAPGDARLAYTAASEDGSRIHLIEDATAAEPVERVLTPSPGSRLKPSWSPDGKFVAYYVARRGPDGPVFDAAIVSSDGGLSTTVAQDVVPGERRGPAWLPDASGLVVVRRDPTAGDPIAVVPLQGETWLVETGTVNNAEVAVWGRPESASWKLAFVAQGAAGRGEQRWRRVYTSPLRKR